MIKIIDLYENQCIAITCLDKIDELIKVVKIYNNPFCSQLDELIRDFRNKVYLMNIENKKQIDINKTVDGIMSELRPDSSAFIGMSQTAIRDFIIKHIIKCGLDTCRDSVIKNG